MSAISVPIPEIPASDLMYLNGPFAPVREELTAFDLKVTGNIPKELNGRLLRIGSNPYRIDDVSKYHWFAGTGMVHGLQLREGRALWYRNRYLLDDQLAKQRGVPPVPGPRALDHGQQHHGQHWININLNNTTPVPFVGKILATSEGGVMPVEIDREQLTTLRTEDFGGTFVGAFSGHPHIDPDTGETHAIGYYWEWDHLKYMHFDLAGRLKRVVEIPAPTRPIVHDFAMTKRYAIVLDSPLVYDAERAGQGYMGVGWHEGLPTEFILVPREGIAEVIQRIAIPPQCIFHFVNAYDWSDGRIVVDAVRNDRSMRDDKHGPLEGRLTMNRYLIDPVKGTVDIRIINAVPQELPRIDDRKFSRPHRYSYTWGVGHEGSLIKNDHDQERMEQYRCEPGTYPGEPVFHPASADAAEDDGWLLSYIGDLRTNSSELAIFHAQDLAAGPIARIQIPQRVPVTFHGNFFPDAV